MGWFKKVFRKSKDKKSSDQSTANEGHNEASDHGNEPEPQGDHRQPEAPEENKDDPEENTNRVAPILPDPESPLHRPYEPGYQPWSIYGPGGWRPASEASGQQNLGSFSHPLQHIGGGDRSSGRYTGYDNFAGSSGQVNNYWSPPRMLHYDRWNRGQYVKSDHDVWTSAYWLGLFQPPPGGWS